MLVIFSDLDGALMDSESYSWEEARPILDCLRLQGVPVVLTTSKTRAEVEPIRKRIGNLHPYIIENGGAVWIPAGYFPFEIKRTERAGDMYVRRFGMSYLQLVGLLRRVSLQTGVPVRGFADLSAQRIAEITGLPPADAVRAKRREHDEAFSILDPGLCDALLHAIEKAGVRWTRGGRFYHIMGHEGKGAAVVFLREQYRRLHPDAEFAGLGDGLNDVGMLCECDIRVVIRSEAATEVARHTPGAYITEAPGPEGWREAVQAMLNRERSHMAGV